MHFRVFIRAGVGLYFRFMAGDPFFITTAIDYTNAAPHIGHAYEKILADVFARHYRQRGRDVFFLTGVDQHGQKVQQAAQKRGTTPDAFAREVTGHFLALWARLGISYDAWAETTAPKHRDVVQKILTRLHDCGDLYKASHSGFYSVRQEQFLTDKERGPDGTFGDEWGEVVELSEENWYFKSAALRDWLIAFVDAHPDFVFPDFRGRELRRALDRMSGDLCISRPKTRLSWGIEFPFDPEFVTYVWFDALINYISFAGYLSDDASEREAFERRWPTAVHVIGKDILVPAHGVYWPVMLKAIGISDEHMPRLLVHGYINLGGSKVSKSVGNVVDPVALIDLYGAETLRYYLMRDCVCGQDMEFNEERLISRFNVDLANGLGNLLNRALNMTHRYRDGVLSAPENPDAAVTALRDACEAARIGVCDAFDARQPHAALEQVAGLVTAANTFAENEAPWKLAKDETQAARLDGVLAAMIEAAWTATSLLVPFTPQKCGEALAQLGLAPMGIDTPFTPIAPGHRVEKPSPVFPRLEKPADA